MDDIKQIKKSSIIVHIELKFRIMDHVELFVPFLLFFFFKNLD